ncbi:MAG: T9SS type A sorting domain-containing protein, partial [Bacteroidia bacterium]
ASSAPNAMQFFPNTAPSGTVLGHDFSRYSFSSTDDGKVRSLGILTNDPNAAGNVPGDTALYLMTGSFNAGVFNWTGDKFQPATALQTNGTTNLYGESVMAWNEAGTIGYVVGIGALNSATLSNRGWQPIVYKTTNSGASWTMIQGIDFNSPAFAPILNPIVATQSNTNLVIPFFNVSEGFDATVDMNGKLHIVSTVVGTYDLANDSLAFTASFTNWDGESYNYPHVAGARPYIYDFIGDGTGPWTYVTVDSMSSEEPGGTAGSNGFNDNPWDTDANGNKVSSGARLSLTRSTDGQFIMYSWAETDTNFTSGSHKWNSAPNLKARAARIGAGSGYTLSPTEINVTKPAPGNGTPNAAINGRAFFHYTSRTTSMPLCGATTTINVPTSVSNNPSTPLTQASNNTHWYSTAKLDFSGIACPVGINENAASQISGLSMYPNPTQNVATLGVDLKQNGPIAISVYNMVGQLVTSTKTEGTIGNNQVNVDLTGLASGIYMVKVNVNGVNTTAKLIKE